MSTIPCKGRYWGCSAGSGKCFSVWSKPTCKCVISHITRWNFVIVFFYVSSTIVLLDMEIFHITLITLQYLYIILLILLPYSSPCTPFSLFNSPVWYIPGQCLCGAKRTMCPIGAFCTVDAVGGNA